MIPNNDEIVSPRCSRSKNVIQYVTDTKTAQGHIIRHNLSRDTKLKYSTFVCGELMEVKCQLSAGIQKEPVDW